MPAKNVKRSSVRTIFSYCSAAALALAISSLSSPAFSQDETPETQSAPESRTADECFAQGDEACLEEIYSTIVTESTPEKSKAVYLLGKLKLDKGEDLEGAKDQFMMTLMFGEGFEEQALKEIVGMYESGAVEFETTDCLAIKDNACFEKIIAGDDPIKTRNAQYLLAKKIVEENPRRALELYTASAEAGHGTSGCKLAQFYADDGMDTPKDYHKSKSLEMACYGKRPFKKFNKKHFTKYAAQPDHKAYAYAENGYGHYVKGITNPGWAATLAMKYCETYAKKRSGNPECSVVNVDGTWVEDAKLIPVPDAFASADDLITLNAKKSYLDKYVKDKTDKIFVQSSTGAWTWKTKGTKDVSLEQLKAQALESCNKNFKEELENRCKVVNINGKWVNE